MREGWRIEDPVVQALKHSGTIRDKLRAINLTKIFTKQPQNRKLYYNYIIIYNYITISYLIPLKLKF